MARACEIGHIVVVDLDFQFHESQFGGVEKRLQVIPQRIEKNPLRVDSGVVFEHRLMMDLLNRTVPDPRGSVGQRAAHAGDQNAAMSGKLQLAGRVSQGKNSISDGIEIHNALPAGRRTRREFDLLVTREDIGRSIRNLGNIAKLNERLRDFRLGMKLNRDPQAQFRGKAHLPGGGRD
jgi:hypothetical protein